MANTTIKQYVKDSFQNYAVESYRRFAQKSDFDTANAKLTTLIGSDANKSVRTIANEELAAQLIPENAKEAMDTLQEIANWLQDHPDEVADINSKLTLGTYDDEGTQKQYATVKAYVEAYVASQISAAGLSGSNAVQISNNTISLIIDTANANGLTIGEDGIKLGLADASNNGALSSTDWAMFNAKQEQIAVGTATGKGNVITGISLNADNKTLNIVKDVTALQESDFEALTAEEITTLFNAAKTAYDAEVAGS